MGFEIRIEGEKVHEIDLDPSLIEKIHVYGPSGEAGVVGSGFGDTYLNLTFEYRSRNNLEVITEAQQAANREDAEKEEIHTARPSGKLVGEEQAEEDRKYELDEETGELRKVDEKKEEKAPAKASTKTES